jgi:hypothetical protein
MYYTTGLLAYQPINPWEIPARRKAAGAKFKAAETAATAACAETLFQGAGRVLIKPRPVA